MPEPSPQPAAPAHTPWLEQVETREIHSPDGVRVRYQVVGGGARSSATPFVLANGLGGRLYSWEPIIERFAAERRILTWDYRGLFESASAAPLALAIPNHAADLRAVMDAERIDRAVVCGWSMGVQVALEAAAQYPERVERLVLLNGTYGHVLSTGFQPLVRLPWLSRYLHDFIDLLLDHQEVLQAVGRLVIEKAIAARAAEAYAGLRGRPRIRDMAVQYAEDMFGPDPHGTVRLRNYLRLFQELDAHSAYHHLRLIRRPALVVSGGLDVLTPAYQSREMVRKLPRAEHLELPLGTHFVLLEYPEVVVERIAAFVEGRGP